MDEFAKKYPALARLRDEASTSDTLRSEGARALEAFQEAAIRLAGALGDDVAADAAALWSDALRAWRNPHAVKKPGRPKSNKAAQRKLQLAELLVKIEYADRGGYLPQGFKRGRWRTDLARYLAGGCEWKVAAKRKEIQNADALRKRAAGMPRSRLMELAGFAPNPEKK